MIICNFGSQNEHTTNVLMLKCHYISLPFDLHNRQEDS